MSLNATLDRLLTALTKVLTTSPDKIITEINREQNSVTLDTPKPLPPKVQRALILQFPERNRERLAHEAMARDLVAAGVSEGEIEQMIADGRRIDV